MDGMAAVSAKASNYSVPAFGGPHDGMMVGMPEDALFAGNRVSLPGDADYIVHRKRERWRMTYVPMLARDRGDIVVVATPDPCEHPDGHDFGSWFLTPKGAWARQCKRCDGFQGGTEQPEEGA